MSLTRRQILRAAAGARGRRGRVRAAATRWPAGARSCPTTSRRSASPCSATPRPIRPSSRCSRRRCGTSSRAEARTRLCRQMPASTASSAARSSPSRPNRLALTDAQLASRYRFTVVVKVAFEDVNAQKTLWENPALPFSDEYEVATPGSGRARCVRISWAGACRVRPAVDRFRTLSRQRHSGGVLASKPEGRGPRAGAGIRMSSPTEVRTQIKARQDRAAVPA